MGAGRVAHTPWELEKMTNGERRWRQKVSQEMDGGGKSLVGMMKALDEYVEIYRFL